MASLIFGRTYRQVALKSMGAMYDIIEKNFKSDVKKMAPLLRQSGLHMTVGEYVSVAMLTTTLAIVFSLYFFSIIFFNLFAFPGIVSLAFTFMMTFLGFAASVAFFYTYPGIRINAIERSIELNLPYLTTHMGTIAGTGVPLPLIFELVGQFQEYGVLAEECRKIARDTRVFGIDILTAMSKAASETPSPHFKELLWAMVSTVRSGGDLRELLLGKSRSFLEIQETAMNSYVEFLGILSEMYIIGFVSAPLFIIILITVMSLITQLPLPASALLALIIYIGMPMAYSMFLVIIKVTRPIGV
ncbi:MAG: type II secretion system F family protein [DPANN group archaeon]|nr:type II secretion system F family protein [DPANN group archaeon]